MQRSTIATREPWDKPVSIPDPHVAVSRQLLSLPAMRDTSARIREGDAMAANSSMSPDVATKAVGCESTTACRDPNSKPNNLFRNFRRSEEPFYNNPRSVTVSPGAASSQNPMRRRSYVRPTHQRLPPRVTSLDSARSDDSGDSYDRYGRLNNESSRNHWGNDVSVSMEHSGTIRSMENSSHNIRTTMEHSGTIVSMENSSSINNMRAMENSSSNFRGMDNSSAVSSTVRSVTMSPVAATTPTHSAIRRQSYRRSVAPRLPPRVTSLDSARSNSSGDSCERFDRLNNESGRNIWGSDMSSSGIMMDQSSSNRQISAKAFSAARQMAEAHRRQRNKRWERKLCDASERTTSAEVTSPHTNRKVVVEEAVQQVVQDQQRRSQDSIPPHVDVNNNNSSASLGGSGFDDDELTFYSRSPGSVAHSLPPRRSSWAQEKREEMPPPLQPMGPTEPEQPVSRTRRASVSVSGNSNSEGPVPQFLDKTYLRNLAAKHRDRYGSGSSTTHVSPPESPAEPQRRPRRPSTSFRGLSRGRPSQPRRPSMPQQLSPLPPPQQQDFVVPPAAQLPQLPPRQQQVPQPPPPPRQQLQQPTPPPRQQLPQLPPPRQHYQQPQQQEQPRMVEICPGLSAQLRGLDETRKAVASNFYATNILCFGCATKICSIADVQYTICPHCRVISPIEDDTFDGEKLAYRWGLGLGFTHEALRDMKAELAATTMRY